jgi:hypothetical protein
LIIPQAEIDLITGSIRRRMMRLPLAYGEHGELIACRYKRGRTYPLKPKPSAPSAVKITVLEVRREKLAAITLRDARKEGHHGIQGALDAFKRRHGEFNDRTEVWVIAFAKDKDGDVAAAINQDDPLFLSMHGDYTFSKSSAVKGEPEVMMPFAEDLEKARQHARDERVNPRLAILARMGSDAESLAQSLTAMKERNRLKLILKEIEKLQGSVRREGTIAAEQCVLSAKCPQMLKAGPGLTARIPSCL